MAIALRLSIAALSGSLLVFAHAASTESVKTAPPEIEKYPQQTLLKNWALCRCLAKVTTDPATRDDADATAAAYLEFGKKPIEAYEALSKLVDRYAKLKYGGSINSAYNTMKCVDLFHSKELDALTEKLVKRK